MPSIDPKIIMEYVFKLKDVDNIIRSKVPAKYQDDMRSYLYLQLLEMNPDKLSKSYESGTIKFIIYSIVHRNMDKSCLNCFYNKYISFDRNTSDTYEYSNIDDIPKMVEKEILHKRKVDLIENYLNGIKPWGGVQAFREYYFNGLNCRQISEKYNINERTINRWINIVVKYLKNKIKQNDTNVNDINN